MNTENFNQNVNERPEAIVLVGVPGSGKSTWIKRHIASSNKEYVVVSSDDVLEQIAAEKGLKYSDVHKDYIGKATAISKKMFRDALAERKNVIIDKTNVSKKTRRGVLQQLPKDYEKVAVVFNTEDREVERRLRLRAEETGKFIPPFVMKDMYSRWESPSRDEGFDRIVKV